MFSFLVQKQITIILLAQKNQLVAAPQIVIADSCVREREISHFELVESATKEAGASDESCEDENSKIVVNIGLTNDSATWLVVMSRNVRNYLAQGDESSTVTTDV